MKKQGIQWGYIYIYIYIYRERERERDREFPHDFLVSWNRYY